MTAPPPASDLHPTTVDGQPVDLTVSEMTHHQRVIAVALASRHLTEAIATAMVAQDVAKAKQADAEAAQFELDSLIIEIARLEQAAP